MRGIRIEKLRRLYEAAKRTPGVGEEGFFADLRDAFAKKELVPSDFSIRECFEHFVEGGRELVESFRPGRENFVTLKEAGSYVSTTHFSNITGQIVYTTVLEEFNNAAFIGDRLCKNVPTQFETEKIPGVAALGDDSDEVGETQPYPYAKMSETYIETPKTVKRGEILGVSKEAIFFDRTGLVLRRASQIGQSLGFNKEKRILDCALGITTTFKRNGVSMATYLSSGLYVNIVASNALVNYTDIEAALLAFDAMTDPDTGEPIIMNPQQLIVPSALRYTAKNVVNATQIRIGDGASATVAQYGGNPIDANFSIESNAYVKQRTSSASTWFIGDFPGAFEYRENWPITVIQAPANSEAEFLQDVVSRFKVTERGVPAVVSPWKVVKCTA